MTARFGAPLENGLEPKSRCAGKSSFVEDEQDSRRARGMEMGALVEMSSIQRRCQPWQQMLMFFVRTQRQHEWKSPAYRFNRRQFAAFEKLIEAAEEAARMIVFVDLRGTAFMDPIMAVSHSLSFSA